MSLDALHSQRATSAYQDTLTRATTSGGVTATSTPPPTDATGTAAKIPDAAGAVITLSPGAQFFAQVLAAAQGAPEVRADKMAAVQARLGHSPDAGVDVDALAAKLLDAGAA